MVIKPNIVGSFGVINISQCDRILFLLSVDMIKRVLFVFVNVMMLFLVFRVAGPIQKNINCN